MNINANIVYGFKDCNRLGIISENFLNKFKISKFVGCDYIYGLCCELNKKTGEVTISDADKDIVHAAFNAANSSGKYNKYEDIGFIVAVDNEFYVRYSQYDPRECYKDDSDRDSVMSVNL